MNWQRMCPEFLKKRLFRYLLQHFLGSFFKEKLSLEQLTIDIYNGTARVECLHLDTVFLNEKLNNIYQSELPIEIVHGFVGHLSVYIPWHDLINEDCKLIVNDIQILIRTKSPTKKDVLNNSMFSSLEKSSMFIDSIMKTSVHIAQECFLNETEPELNIQANLLGLEAFASTIDSILSRIKINLEKIEIRIEHLNSTIRENEFPSGMAFELKIDSLQYFDIISQTLTRSFQIDGISLYFDEFIISNNEYSSVNASYPQIINTKKRAKLLSTHSSQLIQLTINNSTPNLLLELNAQFDSIKIILNKNHINSIIDFLSKFSSNSEINESSLMNSEIYYSLLNEDDTINLESNSIIPEKIIDQIKNDQKVNKLNKFKFNINMISLILINNESIFDQISSKYFEFNQCDCDHHFLIELKSISIDSFQKEKISYSMTESNIQIQTFNIREHIKTYEITILELNNDALKIELIAYEPNETNSIYANKFENTSIQIKPLINLEISFLKRFQNFFQDITIPKKKQNNLVLRNFDLKCESIKINLIKSIDHKEALIIELIDFNVQKSSIEAYTFKILQINCYFQSDSLVQFILIKLINGSLNNKKIVFKTKNYNEIDSLESKFNINIDKPNKAEDDDEEDNFSPFSKVYSLISNETNSRIVKTANKSEIASFKNQSKSNANSIIDLSINNIQIIFYDQKFLANIFSFIMSLTHSDLNEKRNKKNDLLFSMININSAQIKAFVTINDSNSGSEFDSDLNSIEICSALSNQNQTSLKIHQFILFHSSINTDLIDKNNIFPFKITSNEIIAINRKSNSRNPMISIGLKSKFNSKLIAFDFDSLCINNKLNDYSWINKLISLFELIELNEEKSLDEIHFNLSNCFIYYKPRNLDFESMISIKYFHFSMVNHDEENLFISNIEDVELFIIKNDANICVATSNLFELSLKTKKLKPFIQIDLVTSSIQFKTCLDSAQALIELISSICKKDNQIKNENSNVLQINSENETFTDLEQQPDSVDPLLFDYQIIESTQIDQLANDCEYEIKSFEKKSPILIKQDYFKPSLIGFDLLKAPDWLPVSVSQYSIQELTANWILFKGSDFKQTRSANENMEISIVKLKTKIDLFETDHLYRCALSIGDIKIKDSFSDSNYNMFLYRYESDQFPRRTFSSMLFIKFLCSKSKTNPNLFEFVSKVAVQPLRFNLDQDALIFLHDFFSQLIPHTSQTGVDSSVTTNQSELTTYYESNILFKKFIFSPDLLIRFDFTGKYDNNSDSSSITKLLMPAVQLSNTEIKLKQMCLENIKSELLFDQLKQTWFNDIKQYQVMNLLKGWTFLNSVFQFCEGFSYLVSYPLEQYRRDGRLFYGIRRGGAAFSSSTVMATLDSTNKLFYTTKKLTDFIYYLVSPIKKKSSRKNQPNDFREGINNAFDTANEFIQEIITDNINPIGGVLSAPLAALACTSNALFNISSGIRNQLDPDEKREIDQKWK